MGTLAHASVMSRPTLRPELEYRARSSLLTAAELSFYKALQSAVGHRFAIFAKVRLLDLCAECERRSNFVAFSKVVQKHVDFVLCDPHDTRPLLVVELDDPSHLRADRRVRDDFLDRVFGAMSIGLLREWVSRSYDVAHLARRVDAALR